MTSRLATLINTIAANNQAFPTIPLAYVSDIYDAFEANESSTVDFKEMLRSMYKAGEIKLAKLDLPSLCNQEKLQMSRYLMGDDPRNPGMPAWDLAVRFA